jgi:hypothetical protein
MLEVQHFKNKKCKKNPANAVFEMEKLLPFWVEDQMLKKVCRFAY